MAARSYRIIETESQDFIKTQITLLVVLVVVIVVNDVVVAVLVPMRWQNRMLE